MFDVWFKTDSTAMPIYFVPSKISSWLHFFFNSMSHRHQHHQLHRCQQVEQLLLLLRRRHRHRRRRRRRLLAEVNEKFSDECRWQPSSRRARLRRHKFSGKWKGSPKIPPKNHDLEPRPYPIEIFWVEIWAALKLVLRLVIWRKVVFAAFSKITPIENVAIFIMLT